MPTAHISMLTWDALSGPQKLSIPRAVLVSKKHPSHVAFRDFPTKLAGTTVILIWIVSLEKKKAKQNWVMDGDC